MLPWGTSAPSLGQSHRSMFAGVHWYTGMAAEWDPAKAKSNVRKHGDEAEHEERWVTIGMDCLARVLVIVYTWRGDEVRLISARLATPVSVVNMRRIMKNEYDFSKGKRGPVIRVPTNKTRVTIRLDEDILNWFRRRVDDAGGGNYQTLINEALRDFVDRKQEALETTLRRVIRDELRRNVG